MNRNTKRELMGWVWPIVIGTMCGATFFFLGRATHGGGPPVPGALGAGCVGGANPMTVYFAADGTLGITEAEFYADFKGIWTQGTFDPTAETSPCDRLPGHGMLVAISSQHQ